MASGKSKSFDYDSLIPTKKNGKADGKTLSSFTPPQRANDHSEKKIEVAATDSFPPNDKTFSRKIPASAAPDVLKTTSAETSTDIPVAAEPSPQNQDLTFAQTQKAEKKLKQTQKDAALLESDRWIYRNGHALTFVGVYLFSIFVFFRPYEIIPGLGFLNSGAFVIALATLAIYLPSQLTTEGNLTILATEVKCVLAMTALAILLMPISRDFTAAWETFKDPYIKAVLIFIVMVNVVRTRQRLMALLWIAISISIYLCWTAIDLYLKGEFKTEGYRVSVDIKGLFENPNEMSLHLVTMIPIVIALGLATKKTAAKIFYFLLTVLFVVVNVITFSRGGFLAFVASMAVLVWKVGRANRVKAIASAAVVGILFVLLAPGNYGLRLLSIFTPELDAVGSSDLRKENLILSILVTIRNPWGIGIGNSPLFGVNNLQTHNAFTQVSSELGLLGFAAYMILMISPFRKISVIEKTLFEKNRRDWFYYMAIGLQASIVAYMVSSFFASVAYIWFVYYLIAYAVAFRRIYQAENNIKEEIRANPFHEGWWSGKKVERA